ncbi:MAG: hypothetical protein PF636_06140 [Actinomycetota bacterium]|nr:hypothetical protein [Actinomycetota bacterium]
MKGMLVGSIIGTWCTVIARGCISEGFGQADCVSEEELHPWGDVSVMPIDDAGAASAQTGLAASISSSTRPSRNARCV